MPSSAAERPQAGVDRAVDRSARVRVAVRQHDRAGAAASLAAPHLRAGEADAVQIVRQQHRGVRIGDHHALAVEPENELVDVRGGFRRLVDGSTGLARSWRH